MTKRGAGAGLRPHDRVEIVVEKGVYRGLGLARHQGQVVFVPRALPGDRVRARVEAVRSGYVEATLEALVAGSRERRPSPCPYAPSCGGCAYQELDYAAQLRLKEGVLRESLQRAGAAWAGEIPIAPSPEEGWRTRASFHLQARGRSLHLGLHEEGSHRVVDLPYCLQLSAAMNGAARGLRGALERRPDLAGGVRGIDLLESLDGRELVGSFETEMDAQQAVGLLAFAEGAPGLTGMGAVAGRGQARGYISLRGAPYVHSSLLGRELRVHVQSFFQANRFLIEPLVRGVVELIPGGGTVLDLYAGVGLFSLPLAAGAGDVLSMELSASAADDAVFNFRQAGLKNLRLRTGDVLEGLATCPARPGERIVLDPPRSGAGAAVVQAIAARRPEVVVYVSCDPPTLGRDLATFAKAGFRPDALRAFDAFPDTFHLETIARLVPG
ncbi:MAG TPA: class I SAM-dependent RNA methyltransferase [Vicinamibacteria bacterium]|nr:class I SAM-dependent RNA methyltransferase [Vicinamibacteria bacterium]